MEKTKQTGNSLTETDEKCPRKHSTLLRLYIIYKVWSVLPKRHVEETNKEACCGSRDKVSIKTLQSTPCIYNRHEVWSVPKNKPEAS